jgi:hypothetical protein
MRISLIDNDTRRKAVRPVRQIFAKAAVVSSRVVSWIRKGYPASVPESGHSYLLALCGNCARR